MYSSSIYQFVLALSFTHSVPTAVVCHATHALFLVIPCMLYFATDRGCDCPDTALRLHVKGLGYPRWSYFCTSRAHSPHHRNMATRPYFIGAYESTLAPALPSLFSRRCCYCWSRRLSRFRSTAVVAQQASAGGGAVPASPLFNLNEAVSCFRNPDIGSDIWLVGLCHRAEPSVEVREKLSSPRCEAGPQKLRRSYIHISLHTTSP